MKIFNTENGIKKVYVQMNDLMMIMQNISTMPASIVEKMFMDAFIVTDENRMNFVCFDEPKEIEFFESELLDWIVDYKKLRNLSEKELITQGIELSQEINQIAIHFNQLEEEEKLKHQEVISNHKLLQYKMNYIAEILWLKQGYKKMPFPIVPDDSGFSLEPDKDSLYKMNSGIDASQILIYRKDGKALSDNDTIPQDFIKQSITLAEEKNREMNEIFDDYEISYSFSEDKKYLIIQLLQKKKKYKLSEGQPKTWKQRIKSIFKKTSK